MLKQVTRNNNVPKIPPKQWDFDEAQVFTNLEVIEIGQMAKGLEKDEILTFYGLKYSDLPSYDKWILDVTFDRARINAKKDAVHKLFGSMTGKDALAGSLAYLSRFGNQNWQSEGTGSKIPKSIKIVVEE